VHAAFSEIRLAAGGQPAVLRALIEVAADLVAELRDRDLESRAVAVIDEARLALEAARSAGLPERDLEWILKTAARLELPEEQNGRGSA
jgi:hypothetical protein